METKKNKRQVLSFYIPLLAFLTVLAAIVAIATSLGSGNEVPGNETENGGKTVPTVVVPSGGDKTVGIEGRIKNGTEKDSEKDTEKTDLKETEASVKEEPKETETEKVEVKEPAVPTFIAPVSGVVTKGFSDTVPVFSETMNDYRVHTGIDISGDTGEAVLAAADGTVGAIWDDPLMGKCMTIVHDAGFVSTYKGLNEIIPDGIELGVAVRAGQPVAALGETALIEVAQEPHLHFELTASGVPVDPTDYVAFTAAESYDE